MRGAVALSHHFLRAGVRAGDRVVDATSGNGHDTLLLAELVGETGKVWGFDIQDVALQATAARLAEAGLRDRVELVAAGHETMKDYVAGPIAAAVFNLGYLPGADKTCITRSEQTLTALGQALELLAPQGILVIAVYTGHPGGAEEGEAVTGWAEGLDPNSCNVWHCCQPNRPATAPFLVLVEKMR